MFSLVKGAIKVYTERTEAGCLGEEAQFPGDDQLPHLCGEGNVFRLNSVLDCYESPGRQVVALLGEVGHWDVSTSPGLADEHRHHHECHSPVVGPVIKPGDERQSAECPELEPWPLI